MMEKKIKNEIEKKAKEYFKEHNGGLEVIAFENKILKVKMLGQCSNCPSAVLELETFLSEEIKERFPEIERISVINDISDEMINFAKKLLNKNI